LTDLKMKAAPETETLVGTRVRVRVRVRAKVTARAVAMVKGTRTPDRRQGCRCAAGDLLAPR
jgi:hypothetical protein